MLITSANLTQMARGFQAIFMDAWGKLAPETLYADRLAERVPSSAEEEVYPYTELLPGLREWTGSRHLLNITLKDYKLANKDWERSFSMERNKVEDDKYGAYNRSVQQLARAARLWPNTMVRAALVAGTSEVCYDGQYFFDTDHPLAVQGAAPTTQSNLHGGRTLNEANLETTFLEFCSVKGDDGEPLEIVPDTIAIPEALRFVAEKLVKRDIVGELLGVDAGSSVTNIHKGRLDILVIPGMADSSSWYLGALGIPGVKPLLYQVRREPNRIDVLNKPTDSNMFNDKTIIAGVDGRGAAGYGLWQLLHKCTT